MSINKSITEEEDKALHFNSRDVAIKWKCYDCVGGNSDKSAWVKIKECPIVKCSLYPFRPGSNANDKKKHLSLIIKE